MFLKTNLTLFLYVFLFEYASGARTIIAHRGAPGYLPEHTLEGVAMAHSWGVDFIEPDVVLTKDNHAVVLHDIHIDTTTNVAKVFPKKKRKDGRFYAIDFTLKELKRLRVTERFDYKTKKQIYSKRFSNTELAFQIPTFKEFIILVQELNRTRVKKIGIYPEIKSPEFHIKEGRDITKIVFNLMVKYGYNKKNSNAYIQCFYLPTLKRLKEEFNSKIKQVFLIAENSWKESSLNYDFYRTEEGIKELAQHVDGIGPYFYHIYKTNLVRLAKEHKLIVHPYTHRIDQLPKELPTNKLFFNYLFKEQNVDGIFSDFADIAKKHLEQM